jgi:hypothetical protein
MVSRLAVIALLAASIAPLRPQGPAPFDPVGKWKIQTVSDEGTPMSVTVDITGRPGAYTGTAVTSEGRSLPLRDLATTPSGMIALFDLPQGAIVVRLVRDPQGKHVGAWGAVEQTFALSAERGK